MPTAVPRARLARFDNDGWAQTSSEVQGQFDALMVRLVESGAPLASRREDDRLEQFEQLMMPALDLTNALGGYEAHWPISYYHRRKPEALSESIAARMDTWNGVTSDQYAVLLNKRCEMRTSHATLGVELTALITLSAPGPTPVGRETTGDPIFAVNFSILGAPAVYMPRLEAEGIPVGVQIIGYPGRDRELFALADWMLDHLRLSV